MTPVAQVRHVDQGPDRLYLWCPGCDDLHSVTLSGNGWTWTGDLDAPTISPSILVTGGPSNLRCHSFVREGSWKFLDDSTHHLAGQAVALVPLPDWLIRETTE